MAVLALLKNVEASRVLDERAYILAVISEIWMLVDYVVGSSSKALENADFPVPSKQRAGTNMAAAEMLELVSETEARLTGKQPVLPSDRAYMQIVRDSLNVLVRPASGLSIAYTAMVTGPLRRRSASRFALAQEAYPGLAGRGKWHRRMQIAVLLLLALATGAAVWESAKVALGKALLENIDTLRSQQVLLSAEKLKLELGQRSPLDAQNRLDQLIKSAPVPVSAYRLCDRAKAVAAIAVKADLSQASQPVDASADAMPPIYSSAEERDVCGRDYVLLKNFGIVHDELTTYTLNWPSMVGSVFEVVRNVASCFGLDCKNARTGLPASKEGQDDVEFRVAPILLVWGNFALPIIFSFIGSAIFVTLDHYKKISESLLIPKDYFLSPVRLALGLVVGACVGLFFSAYGPMTQPGSAPTASALVSSLTLSASAVAFLAGFGAETVFILLESVIGRVFTLPAAPK